MSVRRFRTEKEFHVLGKLEPRIDTRTLKLEKYIGALHPPPLTVSFQARVTNWGMMGNDSLGDCTVACAGHMIEQWTAYAQNEFRPPDSEIIAAYSAVSGYTPGDPSTDNGAVVLDVLNYWRQTGIAGRKIRAYAALAPGDVDQMKQAVQLFGNCYLGVQLPVSAQQDNTIWHVHEGGPQVGDNVAGSWGGHAIPVVAYDERVMVVVTWGALMEVSWNFFKDYCDEAYAVLSSDWIEADQLAPSGFDSDQLLADLTQITASKAKEGNTE